MNTCRPSRSGTRPSYRSLTRCREGQRLRTDEVSAGLHGPLRTIRGMLEGALPVCPPFGTGWVDVRDVADLHLRAMTDPAAAGEPIIATSGQSLRMVEVSRILRQRLGDRAAKAPTLEMPLILARALSVFNPQL